METTRRFQGEGLGLRSVTESVRAPQIGACGAKAHAVEPMNPGINSSPLPILFWRSTIPASNWVTLLHNTRNGASPLVIKYASDNPHIFMHITPIDLVCYMSLLYWSLTCLLFKWTPQFSMRTRCQICWAFSVELRLDGILQNVFHDHFLSP
ncbi:unnamed protein product [Ixodes pacificus]